MAKIGDAIVAVIVVSGVFSFWQEHRVEQTLAVLRKLLPQQVKVLRDGKVPRGVQSNWYRGISSCWSDAPDIIFARVGAGQKTHVGARLCYTRLNAQGGCANERRLQSQTELAAISSPGC
jgi:hypothetical protein